MVSYNRPVFAEIITLAAAQFGAVLLKEHLVSVLMTQFWGEQLAIASHDNVLGVMVAVVTPTRSSNNVIARRRALGHFSVCSNNAAADTIIQISLTVDLPPINLLFVVCAIDGF